MVLTILVWPFIFFLQSEQTEQLLLTLLILDLVQKACLAYKSEYVHTEIRGNGPPLEYKGHLKRSHLSGQQTIHPMRSQAGAYLLTIAAPESSLSSWNLVNVSHTWRTDMKQLPQMLFHFLIHAFSFKVPSVCPPSLPLFSYLLLNRSPSHSFTHILTLFERH